MKYEGVYAKIKGMRKHMLNLEDYEVLCHCPTVQEVALGLKDYPQYEAALASLPSARRHLMEERLYFTYLKDYQKLYSFLTEHKVRSFLKAYFLKMKIYVIKQLLGIVFEQRETDINFPTLNFLLENERQGNLLKIGDIHSLNELIESLKGTPFHRVLSRLNNDHVTLFQLEMGLDLYYYLNLWKHINDNLAGADKRLARQWVGTEIDLRNILWLYRFKKFYRMEPALLYTNMVPLHYHLRKTDIVWLAETKDINGFQEALLKTKYGGLQLHTMPLENVFADYMNKLKAKLRKQDGQSIIHAVFYLEEKETEIKNLTSLIEGVRYGIQPDQILTYLHLPKKTEVG